MSRCQVCNLTKSKRLDLERAYLNNQSQAMLSREYDVSEDSIRNHMQNHVSRQLATSVEMQRALESGTLISELEDTLREMKEIVVIARKDKNYRLVLDALKAKMGPIELYSRMLATAHMMRAQELQSQQSQQEDSLSRERQEGLERLSDAELSLLVALNEKMSGERKDDVVKNIIDDYRHSYSLPVSKSKRIKHRSVIPGIGFVEDVPVDEDDYEDEPESEDAPEVILDPSPKRITRRRAVYDDPEALETLDDLSVSPLGVDLSSVAGVWGQREEPKGGPGIMQIQSSSPQVKKLFDLD